MTPPSSCRGLMCHNLRMNADKKATRIQPAAEQVDLAVEVFRMLADSTRVGLLWALLDGELAVNELAEAVGKPAAAVSQHLAKLRMSRLVRTRRAGTQVFYRIESSHAVAVAEVQQQSTARQSGMTAGTAVRRRRQWLEAVW